MARVGGVSEARTWTGGAATTRATCVLEDNPGPMTLDGTNTWVLHEPGADEAVVVDPGELDEPHLRAVADLVEARGARVALVLLTHGHHDHADGAERFADLVGAPVRGAGRGAELADGERIEAGGLDLRVVRTPGHTSDSVSFVLPADRALLTGDMVLGRGTTVVAWPDGELGAYLRSLDVMSALADGGEVATVLPGHGPVLGDAAGVLASYRRHRLERLEQVRRAVAGGATDARAVVETVYADVPREVWPAAELSVRAQLDFLAAERA
ncbi:MBL fold metallo-hydrolase [Lapillicoccus jejuensis]|uniref:Glyoxylase-like metal-dependent hydrolase (Beta-lactamase superfamily II) n=1 Tax=Lapillicoccus jejuensis TaxID=402171 RepID=A0A542DXV1_9MICO|nr:glyoxylase-like metal-dependent hydrolase (beta-lactamase superfamily II) [Lapillicoccus jejuensis]